MSFEADGSAIISPLPQLNETNQAISTELYPAVEKAIRAKCNSNQCGWRDLCHSNIYHNPYDNHVWIYPDDEFNMGCVPETCVLTNNVILADRETSTVRLAF